jgi:hypothetical protein
VARDVEDVHSVDSKVPGGKERGVQVQKDVWGSVAETNTLCGHRDMISNQINCRLLFIYEI